MEKSQQFNPNSVTISWSASVIEKVHSCEDCPIRKLALKQPHSFFARMHAWAVSGTEPNLGRYRTRSFCLCHSGTAGARQE